LSRPVISAEQRDALYAQIVLRLSALDDLRLAVDEERFDKADRLAREFSDGLRLVIGDLGWGDRRKGSVELTTTSAELKRILGGMRERAIEQFEAERPEQEAFREPWDRAALVRDTCDEVLSELGG
jgi:hypothetical protein